MSHRDGCVVGVDLGTSMVKVGVYTFDGIQQALASAPLALRHVAPGRTEQDLNEFYRVAAAVCHRCVADHDIAPGSVQAIAFSAQMAGVGIVDDEHAPLAPFDSWLDTRCGGIVEELSPMASDVVASSGCAPTISIGPKMLWWQRNRPEVCDSASSFVTAAGFVAAVACGRRGRAAFIDPTHLHFTAVADVANATWNNDLIGDLGVNADLLPEIVECTEIVGNLTAAAAADFGLCVGTPVAAGCGDTAASALGAGALDPGTALDIAGTAGVLMAGTDRFVADVEHRTLMTMRAALPGRWYALAYVGGAGQVVEWICREILGHEVVDHEAYSALSAAVSDVAPGSDGLLMSPHFDGRVAPAAPNMRGAVLGLSYGHTRAHLARAALESIAFEYRTYLDIVGELQPGWTLERVLGAGGGTQSAVWNQIKADVLGAEYTPITGADPGTRGAALVAIAALGHELPGLSSAAYEATTRPDLTASTAYARLHEDHKRWAARLADGYAHATDPIPQPPATFGVPIP